MDMAASLSEADKELLEQYERILEFERQVVAGTHPRINIPGLRHPTAPTTYDPRFMSNVLAPRSGKENSNPRGLPNAALQADESSNLLPITLPKSVLDAEHKPLRQTNRLPKQEEKQLIDYSHNYYHDLGLKKEDRLTAHSIRSAYRHRAVRLAPTSVAGQKKLSECNEKGRLYLKKYWKDIETAYHILSQPSLRAEYDKGYTGPTDAALKSAAPRNAHSGERTVTVNKGMTDSMVPKQTAHTSLASRISRPDGDPRLGATPPSAPRAMVSGTRAGQRQRLGQGKIDMRKRKRD